MIRTHPLPTPDVSSYGAVAVTPHHLSTAAALALLARGGNAVDAAMAANAVQGVVAPETCGIGGDLFALVCRPGDAASPFAMNSTGRAGAGADPETLRRAGHDAIPQRHPAAVTVPGCIDGWLALNERLGALDLATVLDPAIRLARDGFPASRELAGAFAQRADELEPEPSAQPMYPGGQPPSVGARIRRADLAATLEAVAADGREAFYGGSTGEAIREATEHMLTGDDLAQVQAEWVEPLSVDVFGHTAWTVPPNSQGYIALTALALVDRMGVGDLDDPAAWHTAIEASRAAAADRDLVLADPDAMEMDVADLLSSQRLDEMAGRIGPRRAIIEPSRTPRLGGTAYLCVVDGGGMGVSLIQSNFYGIGSGRSVWGTGVLLHDRGRGFNLQMGHPNELRPGRRPLHTLSPTVWTQGDRLSGVLGTRGGHIQPQLVAQLSASAFGHALAPGDAMCVPRFSFDPSDPAASVALEPGLPQRIVADLEGRGHDLVEVDGPQGGWGPMSMVAIDEHGLRRGAADPRVDTSSAAAR